MCNTIIFDFLSDPMGGLLTSAREFLIRVREYDKESIIIVLELNNSISSYLGDAGNIKWINIHRPQGFLGWRRLLWQNIFLPKIINKYKATVYISLSHYLPWTIPKSVKKIIGISNLAPFSKAAFDAEVTWKKKLRLKLLSKTIIKSANQSNIVIALSNTCKQELMIRGVNEKKIVIIPNGVDTPSLSKLQVLPNAIKAANYLLSVSHFYRYKNFETLIVAYSQLDSELQHKYPLYLVGRFYDIGYVNEIKTLIAEVGVTSHVHIIEGLFGLDLLAALHNCQLFVFPSLIENSPITLLEAMKCGAVVLTADVPAMREFGEDSVAYFKPQDANDLCDKIKQLLESAHQGKLRTASMKQASQFTWALFTQKLVACYLDTSP